MGLKHSSLMVFALQNGFYLTYMELFVEGTNKEPLSLFFFLEQKVLLGIFKVSLRILCSAVKGSPEQHVQICLES